ncbi:partial Type-1 restriction enzyme EcoKI specificity protein, partial [Patescibacteria group bacterium]
MKKLPDGWDFVQLNKIADIIRGVSYDGSDSEKEDGEGYASILRAGNIGSSITYDDLVYVPERYVSQEQYLKAGDILIATSSGSKHIVGKAAQIKNDKKISFGAFCCVIRPKKVGPEYLNSYFQSKHYKSFVQRTLRGANINNLRISQIRVLEIPLPPLPTQKKIAAVLEKAERLREWRKEADGLTDRFLKSMFLEIFGDPASNPKGWIVSNLEKELSDDTQNGLYK